MTDEDLQHAVKLVAELDSDKFATREQALRELRRGGNAVELALDKALRGNVSAEVRRRAEAVQAEIHESRFAPERLRALRGIEALEYIGDEAAVAVLKVLAGGVPEAEITAEARDALGRLGQAAGKATEPANAECRVRVRAGEALARSLVLADT